MSVDEKRERLIEVSASLLAASPGRRMQTTNLNKALFYVDLTALRDLGDTVTQATYLALKEGPVVAKYPKRLIEALEEAGIASQESHGRAKPMVLQRPAPAQYVTGEINGLIETVARWCSERTAKEVSDFSHQNPGWAFAYADGLGGGGQALPINLHIAMQQLMDDDPWMHLPLDEEMEAILDACDRGETVEW